MKTLTVSLDPGSSLSKIFYQHGNDSGWLTMPPHISLITADSAKQYQSSLVNKTANLGRMWVSDIDNTYALGKLAAERFAANLNLEKSKYEHAIYKTLGVLGYLSELLSLPEGNRVDLGLLLPFGEYQDRNLIEQSLRDTLDSFEFCGRQHGLTLGDFKCRPEGFGMLAKGVDPKVDKKKINIGSLILGHRNASWLQVDHGDINLESSQTNDLGFSWLVTNVQKQTSAFHDLRLAQAISLAGAEVDETCLEGLINTHDEALAASELKRLKSAILTARSQYWLMLFKWLEKRVLGVDLVVVSGGVAPYLRDELQGMMSNKLTWGKPLAKSLAQRFQIKDKAEISRLMDNYGLFCSLCPELTNALPVSR